MLVFELIRELSKFNPDDCVILGDYTKGWCNIEGLKRTGSVVSIIEDYTRPFSSDN